MTRERTLDKIFGYNFENAFTSIAKKIGQYERLS